VSACVDVCPCVLMCVHVYLDVCLRVFVCVSVSVDVCGCLCVYVFFKSVRVCVTMRYWMCMDVSIHGVSMRVSLRVRVCLCECLCVLMCVYACMSPCVWM